MYDTVQVQLYRSNASERNGSDTTMHCSNDGKRRQRDGGSDGILSSTLGGKCNARLRQTDDRRLAL